MKIKYCPTEAMVADILTKPIVGSQFKTLAKQLLGYERPFSWESANYSIKGCDGNWNLLCDGILLFLYTYIYIYMKPLANAPHI